MLSIIAPTPPLGNNESIIDTYVICLCCLAQTPALTRHLQNRRTATTTWAKEMKQERRILAEAFLYVDLMTF